MNHGRWTTSTRQHMAGRWTTRTWESPTIGSTRAVAARAGRSLGGARVASPATRFGTEHRAFSAFFLLEKAVNCFAICSRAAVLARTVNREQTIESTRTPPQMD